MSKPNFLKMGSRPASPVDSAAAFEFLLKPHLLLKHLRNQSPIPGPNQLIIQFIQQANALETTLKGSGDKMEVDGQDIHEKTIADVKEHTYHVKKVGSLKLLAIFIASLGGWNFEKMISEIPGPLLLQLLHETLRLTHESVPEDEVIINTLGSDLPDQKFFSQLLYLRWCLNTVLRDCLPKPPVKANSIPVPGLTEPVVQITNITEEKLTQIRKLFGKSKTALKECLIKERSINIISTECFNFAGISALNDVNLEWDKGMKLEFHQWAAQLQFELGEVFFYESDYPLANEMFSKLNNSPSKEADLQSAQLARLAGYLPVCSFFTNPAANPHYSMSPREALNKEFTVALQQFDVEKLIEMVVENMSNPLLEDTAVDKLYRAINLNRVNCSNNLMPLLDLACSLWFSMKGEVTLIVPNLIDDTPSMTDQATQMIFTALDECKKTNKPVVKALIQLIGSKTNDRELYNRLKERPDLEDSFKSAKQIKMDAAGKGIDTISCGEELKLILTYDPDKMWVLLCDLHKTMPLNVIIEYWKLPKDLERMFNEIKRDVPSACGYILIAKAKELINTHQYDQALTLLSAADKTVRDISPKIAKVVRFEMLYCDLLSTKCKTDFPEDLIRRVKSCLSLLTSDTDVYPREELIMECVSYLLLAKEWEYLSSLHNTRVGFTEYARQMINVCKELPSVEYAKQPGQILFETTLSILPLQAPGKKPRLGNQGILPKEVFRKFLLTVEEPLVLSVMISLLTRLYNIKTSDEEIDRTNDFGDVWPQAIPALVSGTVDVAFLKDLMISLVRNAIKLNPYQAGWLRTYAEIQYTLGNHRDAIAYYMQAANIATNHFMEPVPPYLFNNEVYKRLIKSSVHLKMFNQAALLSLFIDDCEYSTIFKYLGEKSSLDNSSLFMPCIYDINILEYLTNLYEKRGEVEKRNLAIKLTGSLEINGRNPPEILHAAVNKRQSMLLRLIAQQYSL